MIFAVICFFTPSALSGIALVWWCVVELRRRRRECRGSTHAAYEVVEMGDDEVLLCRLCDAGRVAEDGRWAFDEPAKADHHLQ